MMDLSSESVFASVSGAAFETLHPTRIEAHAERARRRGGKSERSSA